MISFLIGLFIGTFVGFVFAAIFANSRITDKDYPPVKIDSPE